MSELFTQTNKQKELFRTEEDIVANIQTQFGMPHTGKDLLLDAKMGPNKDQSSRLDSEPDALSDTGMSDDVGAGDTSGILHDSAGGNKNTITGTNTPRSSRTSAYYDLLRSQHKNGHYKAPAYRVVDKIESPLQAGASALNYHDDFDTDAVQNAGLHMAVEQTVVEGNIMAAAADSAFVIGKQAGNILKDLKDETINAKEALKAGGQVLRLQGGKSVVKIGGATLRSTEQYLSSFQVSTDDFTSSVPGKVKEAATNTGNVLKKITKVVLHPLRNLIAMGKVILISAVILLFLIIVSLLGQMSGTTSTSVFGANRRKSTITEMQRLPRASIRHSRMMLTPMAIPMGTIPSPGSAAIICSMVLLGTMQTVSTMTRRRLFPWQQCITSRTGRAQSCCLLSATMCLLLNSAEHWQRMVWM